MLATVLDIRKCLLLDATYVSHRQRVPHPTLTTTTMACSVSISISEGTSTKAPYGAKVCPFHAWDVVRNMFGLPQPRASCKCVFDSREREVSCY